VKKGVYTITQTTSHKRAKDTAVSAEILLQGSWYALEQSGILLTSAALVYDHGDKSTAVVLSMFGREELGRSIILRKLAKRVTEGEHLSPEDVRRACENHVAKQAAGAQSTTLRTQAPNQLDAALRERMRVDPGSEKWQQASKTVDLSTKAQRKRQPQDRHEMRESALYVDLDATGTAWLRPSTLDSAQCLNEITDAVNDYAGEPDRLRDEVLDVDFPEMAAARAKMNPKVILPEPRWPKFF
jgi:AbiV family abortive infection protein